MCALTLLPRGEQWGEESQCKGNHTTCTNGAEAKCGKLGNGLIFVGGEATQNFIYQSFLELRIIDNISKSFIDVSKHIGIIERLNY